MTEEYKRRLRVLESQHLEQPYDDDVFEYEEFREIYRFVAGFEQLWPKGKGAPKFAVREYQRAQEYFEQFRPELEKIAEENRQFAEEEKKECEEHKRQFEEREKEEKNRIEEEMKRREEENQRIRQEKERLEQEDLKQREDEKKRREDFAREQHEVKGRKLREEILECIEREEKKQCRQETTRRW